MKYEELLPVRELLNRKFKGKPLPNTDYTVRDFIIMPDEQYDKVTHQRFKYAIDIGVPLKEIEKAVDNNLHLDIRIRFVNKEMKGIYSLSDVGFTIEDLENFKFS